MMKNSLLLNKGIYTWDAVEKSISAFSSLADISIAEESNYYHLIFSKCKADVEILLNEFRNYVLIVTIKNTGDLYD